MVSIQDVLFMDTLQAEKEAQQGYISEFGCAVISTILSGHHGSQIYAEFVEMMGESIEDYDPDWIFDGATELMDEASKQICEFMNDDGYRVDTNEVDGSICVFYGECKEEL
ncbi:MAG: hypothetical protein DRN17_06480 [Thermoplasmata archaeon]|nr:MAG: hypothetical protein DRN17_06480 [Thermoplasmata archaeon]